MNRDELSVYADQLQIEGDIRGEIIAIELLPPRPDLELRREALMQKWLGKDYRGWRGVRFRHGFVDLVWSELERVLSTPAGPFMRSVFVSGNNTDVVQGLRLLAAAPRPWLSRLSITTGRRLGDRRGPRTNFVVDDALARALVAATPVLEYLDVIGHRVIEQFPHPTVERLRVVGYDALAAIAEAGAPLPAVRSLFYAFSPDPSGRIAFPERGLPNTLLSRSTLPRLVELDVSANELQRSWDNDHVALFELLAELGVLPQLELLRVPSTHTDDERAALEHARALMRGTVDVTADRPQPLHDLIEHSPILAIEIKNHAQQHRISMRRLGEMMSAAWHSLDDDERDAWFELWRVILATPPEPDMYWDYDQVPAAPHPLATLDRALFSLGDVVDEDFAIAELVAASAQTSEQQMTIRRYAY